MRNLVRFFGVLCSCVLLVAANVVVLAAADEFASALQSLDSQVVPADQREAVANQVRDDLSRRLRDANDRSSMDWRAIRSRDDWERFRAAKLAALKRSLGAWPEPLKSVTVRVGSTVEGDGFRIDKIVFESRPGWWVSANLYRPAKPREAMPGLVICHAHHTPKEHGELQDMGMTWARAGCLVLVPDQVGHGERRQHPFATAADHDKPYRVGHADYYFRYDNAIQLHLIGESLIGLMAWDMMRGVDVLLAQPGIDPRKIILLGAVAGGGDPTAVTGALDERIAAVVPFNFGGPQPETKYPLPDDAETWFHYAGGGSWESTRNLQRSAADTFLPWVIVGGIAPRRLIYAHEFNWDEPRDPVWKRLQVIFGWYGHPEFLSSTHGRGAVSGSSPQDTHCTHIGRVHRVRIHEAFRSWFGIEVTPELEFSSRLPADRLRCWTPELKQELQPKSLATITTELAESLVNVARQKQSAMSADERRREMRSGWSRVLGNCDAAKRESAQVVKTQTADNSQIESVLLTTSTGIRIPLILLTPLTRSVSEGERSDQQPNSSPVKRSPSLTLRVSGLEETGKSAHPTVVVGICSQGKSRLLKERGAEIARLLKNGTPVCLVDPRGIGESKLGDSHGRRSSATSLSSSALMLGTPLLGQQLSDLHTSLAWLREQPIAKDRSLVLWGESLIAPNLESAHFRQPRDDEASLPAPSEPQAPLLALLAGLFEDDVSAVYNAGGLFSWRSVLTNHLSLIAHDVLVPGALKCGDISNLIAAQWPTTRIGVFANVNGWNRLCSNDELNAMRNESGLANTGSQTFHSKRTPLLDWQIDPR